MISAEYLITIDGFEREVEVLGRRLPSGEFEVERVMLEGRNRLADVPEDHMKYMQQRLWHAYLSERHPCGEGGDAVV